MVSRGAAKQCNPVQRVFPAEHYSVRRAACTRLGNVYSQTSTTIPSTMSPVAVVAADTTIRRRKTRGSIRER